MRLIYIIMLSYNYQAVIASSSSCSAIRCEPPHHASIQQFERSSLQSFSFRKSNSFRRSHLQLINHVLHSSKLPRVEVDQVKYFDSYEHFDMTEERELPSSSPALLTSSFFWKCWNEITNVFERRIAFESTVSNWIF